MQHVVPRSASWRLQSGGFWGWPAPFSPPPQSSLEDEPYETGSSFLTPSLVQTCVSVAWLSLAFVSSSSSGKTEWKQSMCANQASNSIKCTSSGSQMDVMRLVTDNRLVNTLIFIFSRGHVDISVTSLVKNWCHRVYSLEEWWAESCQPWCSDQQTA